MPDDHAQLLCPVSEAVLTYVVTQLEVGRAPVVVRLSPTTTSYTITPLTPGTSYSVTVAYVNDVGESEDNPRGAWVCTKRKGGANSSSVNYGLRNRSSSV